MIQDKGKKRPSARFASSEVPLYYQLGTILREQILSGDHRPGAQLPTEAELVVEYGVSRITVRQALRSLEEEGLIRREAGRGTFVTGDPSGPDTIQMDGSLDDLISMGQSTSVKLLDLREVAATRRDAEVFGSEAGSPIVQCTRLRLYHDEPYAHIVNRIPKAIADRFDDHDWETGALLESLARIGLRPGDADQRVRATLATASLARVLETPIGAPLLSVDRVVWTDQGEAIERVHTDYRSDIYSLKVHLTRAADEAREPAAWTLKGSTPS